MFSIVIACRRFFLVGIIICSGVVVVVVVGLSLANGEQEVAMGCQPPPYLRTLGGSVSDSSSHIVFRLRAAQSKSSGEASQSCLGTQNTKRGDGRAGHKDAEERGLRGEEEGAKR